MQKYVQMLLQHLRLRYESKLIFKLVSVWGASWTRMLVVPVQAG